jgi:hypothetical protein
MAFAFAVLLAYHVAVWNTTWHEGRDTAIAAAIGER